MALLESISLFCFRLLGFKFSKIKPAVFYCLNAAAVSVLVCSILSCSQAPPEPAKPLSNDPIKALWWMPSDITFINHQGRGQIALIIGIRKMLEEQPSEDFEHLANQVDHLLMLSRYLGDPSVNAIHGFSDREAVEDSIKKIFHETMGLPITYQRDGAITRASAAGGTRYLGWSNDGWLYYHKDRNRVEAMLKRPSDSTLSLPLHSLLGRVSLDQKYWTVFAGDATGRFIGVPSVGFFQNLTFPKSSEQLVSSGFPITLIFENEIEAQRASVAFLTAGQNGDFSPPLRSALKAFKPRVRGSEVDIDFALFMADTAAMKAALSVMTRGAP